MDFISRLNSSSLTEMERLVILAAIDAFRGTNVNRQKYGLFIVNKATSLRDEIQPEFKHTF